MLIDVGKLKKLPGKTQEFRLEENLAQFSQDKEIIEVSGPVQVDVRATNSGGKILLSGVIKAEVFPTCSRCLEKYKKNLEAAFEREYSIEGGSTDEEVEQLKGDTIDLREAVMESVLLELPMKQVCQEQCKGLCSLCGTNLNEGSCSCEKDDVDPRLEVLKKLLKS